MTVAFTGRDEERGTEVAEATGATFFRCDHPDRAARTTPSTTPLGPQEAGSICSSATPG